MHKSGWSRSRLAHAYLLQCEDMLVEVVLQLLVGIVDAELLKAVALKVLKAKDVEDPYGQALVTERLSQLGPLGARLPSSPHPWGFASFPFPTGAGSVLFSLRQGITKLPGLG